MRREHFEKMEEQIDILLASYNGKKYIEAQISSILNQTYKNIKLIISEIEFFNVFTVASLIS